jgi:hypothetical protein
VKINVFSSQEIGNMDTEMEHGARRGEKRNTYKILLEKLEGSRPYGRTTRRQEDNIKLKIKKKNRV